MKILQRLVVIHLLALGCKQDGGGESKSLAAKSGSAGNIAYLYSVSSPQGTGAIAAQSLVSALSSASLGLGFRVQWDLGTTGAQPLSRIAEVAADRQTGADGTLFIGYQGPFVPLCTQDGKTDLLFFTAQSNAAAFQIPYPAANGGGLQVVPAFLWSQVVQTIQAARVQTLRRAVFFVDGDQIAYAGAPACAGDVMGPFLKNTVVQLASRTAGTSGIALVADALAIARGAPLGTTGVSPGDGMAAFSRQLTALAQSSPSVTVEQFLASVWAGTSRSVVTWDAVASNDGLLGESLFASSSQAQLAQVPASCDSLRSAVPPAAPSLGPDQQCRTLMGSYACSCGQTLLGVQCSYNFGNNTCTSPSATAAQGQPCAKLGPTILGLNAYLGGCG